MASQYDNINDTLGKLSSWSESNESALLEPYTYITSTPGKEIRGAMIEAFNIWLNVPEDKLKIIARVVSMLHSASLLIDDIEDDSQLRRGQPVAHKIYGIPLTINTANYVYFLAYQELFSLRSRHPTSTSRASSLSSAMPTPEEANVPHTGNDENAGIKRLIPDDELDRIVTTELLCLHRGQGLEILWRDSLQCPTEEEYVGMVNDKTGGLFRLGVKLMMACSTTNSDIDYVPLVNMFGIYFQIRDDYMNLQSTQYAMNKGFAEDLTEGKFSFPVVHGVRADTSNRQVLNVLQKRPATPTLKTHTISYLKDHTKSFDYTLSVLRKLEKQTRDEIRRLGGNIKLEGIVDGLHIDDA
jgi:geranylgeranyl diphosphate synthase type 3